MIVVGGVKPPVWPPPSEQIREMAAEFGVPAEGVLAAVEQTWELDADQRRRLLRLLPQFGDLVSHLAAARDRLPDGSQVVTPAAPVPSPTPSTVPSTGGN
jgi:hypothetical protein